MISLPCTFKKDVTGAGPIAFVLNATGEEICTCYSDEAHMDAAMIAGALNRLRLDKVPEVVKNQPCPLHAEKDGKYSPYCMDCRKASGVTP